MKINYLIIGFLLVVCTGCAQPLYIAEQPFLIVSNLSGKKISSIDVKSCDEDESSFQSVAQNLNNRQTIRYIVDMSCIDARAMDFDGTIVATQSRLVLPPKVHWTIY